ncbi:hypothetical protein N9Z47_01065 [bacterium]|nr:hypothetical protein [bacterium]
MQDERDLTSQLPSYIACLEQNLQEAIDQKKTAQRQITEQTALPS